MTQAPESGSRRSQAASRIGFAFGLLGAIAVPGPLLVPLLGHLGTGEPAARQMISRLVAAGNLEVERHGRVAVYVLAGPMLRRYRAIGEGVEPPPWRGRFHVVVHDIPQTRRRARETLLAASAREGFGPYRPGLLLGCQDPRPWVEPFSSDAALRIEVGELAVDREAAHRMADVAWDYPGLRARVGQAVDRLVRSASERSQDGWVEARRLDDAFATATPLWSASAAIPRDLLPEAVGLDRLGELVAAIGRQSGPVFAATVEDYVAASPYRELLRRDPGSGPRDLIGS